MGMEKLIILSNIGSASKKYSVYRGDLEVAWFHFEKDGPNFLSSSKINFIFEKKHITYEQYNESLAILFDSIKKLNIVKEKKEIGIVGIRVVVPDSEFVSDTLCTQEVFEKLKSLEEIDPIHISPTIEEIKLIQDFFERDTLIYFISDSFFHLSSSNKIPLNFEKPLNTIGYHGLSCESVLSTLKKQDIKHEKLIVVHLGGGSSVTAIKNGSSVYNSMQFSPIDGILMSTRSGSIDPFAILFYMKQHNLNYQQTLEHLYSQSGLKSLSGISGDLREIREEAFKGNKDAKYAIMQFVDSVAAYICKASSYIQGVDTLIFTGTIGIRASYIREMVIEKLMWLGFILDHSKNSDLGDFCSEISSYDSKIKIFVIQIDEMKEMHRHVQKFSQK